MAGLKTITIDVLNARSLWLAVRAALAVSMPGVSVVYGRRELTKQVNQGEGGAARVVVHSGDLDGKAGEYGGATGKGHPARVYNKRRPITVHVWAADTSDLTDDSLQEQAVEVLEDAVLNAIHGCARGRAIPADPEWVVEPTERVFGRALTFLVWLEIPVVKTPIAAIPAHPAEPPIVRTSLATPAGSELVD